MLYYLAHSNVCTTSQLPYFEHQYCWLCNSVINLSDKITTLEVTIDSTLSLKPHVSNICKTAYFHLQALKHIRPVLTHDMAMSIAVAMVQSRLDYANSLLYNTSACNINKLQCVQNMVAGLSCAIGKSLQPICFPNSTGFLSPNALTSKLLLLLTNYSALNSLDISDLLQTIKLTPTLLVQLISAYYINYFFLQNRLLC